MSTKSPHRCTHPVLRTTPSSHAEEVGYKSRTAQQLYTAATGSRKRITSEYAEYLQKFPAPLVLPDDELAHDPKCPPQSFMAWKSEKERNVIDEDRTVVYVAEYPAADPEMVKTMGTWEVPRIESVGHQNSMKFSAPMPRFTDVLAYLQAFFHGIEVKQLNNGLAFTTWEDTRPPVVKSRSKPKAVPIKKSSRPSFVGLTSSSADTTTRIRVRHLPESSNSPYLHQLNLSDILDHAISILPSDAYALLLLVSHDLYEDDDDDFCVGRAYGGSRIAVVSGARYQPTLNDVAGIDVSGQHRWPGSHCQAFVGDCCLDEKPRKRQNLGSKAREGWKEGVTVEVPNRMQSEPTLGLPHRHMGTLSSDSKILETEQSAPPRDLLLRAITAHSHALSTVSTPSSITSSLFLRHLSLTASHELLHCFALDHCTYLACAMQGTSSLAEDTRQPPYLCPICENKVAAAIVLRVGHAEKLEDRWWADERVGRWRQARRAKLIEYCNSRGENNASMDAGFAAVGEWYAGFMDIEQPADT